MLSERYRPKAWTDFVAQPIIAEIEQACGDEWLFDGGGERWLFESDGIAGCGKTSAAYVTAKAIGCSDFAGGTWRTLRPAPTRYRGRLASTTRRCIGFSVQHTVCQATRRTGRLKFLKLRLVRDRK